MTHDGCLALPTNYNAIDEDEMQYIEGGGTLTIVITANTQRNLVKMATPLILGAAGVLVGGVLGGPISAIVGGVLGGLLGKALAPLISSKVVKGDISFGISNFLLKTQTIRI